MHNALSWWEKEREKGRVGRLHEATLMSALLHMLVLWDWFLAVGRESGEGVLLVWHRKRNLGWR